VIANGRANVRVVRSSNFPPVVEIISQRGLMGLNPNLLLLGLVVGISVSAFAGRWMRRRREAALKVGLATAGPSIRQMRGRAAMAGAVSVSLLYTFVAVGTAGGQIPLGGMLLLNSAWTGFWWGGIWGFVGVLVVLRKRD